MRPTHTVYPVRYPWAEDYRGEATVVYGHTPVPEATWLNRTICDTDCVFGGRLTALRWPERDLVSVPAHRTYWEPARPLSPAPGAEAARLPTDLDLDDVVGKRIITTRLSHSVTVREEPTHESARGITQPGIKVRGREYLRIIYGPEYTADNNLVRLRSRGLGHKRSVALREYALGIEALGRFGAAEPLYRVHECVFGVLALESEPVDPRL